MAAQVKRDYGTGSTYRFLSAADWNAVQNTGQCRPYSLDYGVDMFGVNDDSYATFAGYRSKKFRQSFDLFALALDIEAMGDACYLIGRYEPERRNGVPRKVYYFFGVRIVCECFDVNAIIDFTNVLEEGATIERARAKFIEILSPLYDINQLNEYLIEVKNYASDDV